ncbi:hypothetical protein K469DRAFT_784556 [Zopfia rhizophila CBS 207.26]|uniref:Uncharacterized protein n=1 Tax=Zopfia rhizophila CBS 207.26 TaxID=1314779 RepID=A0A6A6E0F3_9PEZI|nr:hypothetical protein K469DRAFT_784556 [Zopfia rhizophila CBS 207.26]
MHRNPDTSHNHVPLPRTALAAGIAVPTFNESLRGGCGFAVLNNAKAEPWNYREALVGYGVCTIKPKVVRAFVEVKSWTKEMVRRRTGTGKRTRLYAAYAACFDRIHPNEFAVAVGGGEREKSLNAPLPCRPCPGESSITSTPTSQAHINQHSSTTLSTSHPVRSRVKGAGEPKRKIECVNARSTAPASQL